MVLMMNGVTAHLDRRNVNGTVVYGIRGTSWNLAKRNEQTGSFEPVDVLSADLTSAELDAKFGVWTDKEVTTGSLWWKKVVRPEDGQIQPDEVVDFESFRAGERSNVWHRLVGQDDLYTFESAQVKVNTLPSGESHATLHTEWNLHHGDFGRFEYVSPLSPPRK
jgi:hypothetical protein